MAIFWSVSRTWDQIYAEYVDAGKCGRIYVEEPDDFSHRLMTPAGNYDLRNAEFVGLASAESEGPTIDIDTGVTIDVGGNSVLRAHYCNFTFADKLAADGTCLYLQLRYGGIDRRDAYDGAAFTAVMNANINLFDGASIGGTPASKGVVDFADGAVALINGQGNVLFDQAAFSGTATNSVSCGAGSDSSAQSLRASGVLIAPFVFAAMGIAEVVVGSGLDGSLPTPSAVYSGTYRVLPGGPGAVDKLYICLKSAADTYSWVQIVSG